MPNLLRPAPWLVLLIAGCGGAEPPSHPATPDRAPDVVLLVIDTLRADRLGCYGYDRPTSPEIDALAAGGTLFEDATAQSSWTQPSMASLFTGHHLSRQVTAPEPDAPTLAEVFADAGYRTLGFSANVLLARDTGFDRGFEVFDGRPMSRTPDGTIEPRTGENLVATLLPHVAEAVAGEDRPPLFLYVQFFDPHAPYLPHPEWESELPVEGLFEPDALAWQRAVHPDPRARAVPPTEGPWGWMLSERARHDQEVREADAWVAELLRRLDALGVGDHAVFALASDHGEGLWDHPTPGAADERPARGPLEFFYQEHGGTMFQDQVHTPLVLWGAGVPAGRRVGTPVENVDLAPTLYDLAGVERPLGLDGQNLLAVADGRLEGRPYLFSVALGRALVREVATGLTLIVIDAERKGGGVELYDLDDDPLQRNDLAAERPEDVQRLVERLEAWQAANPTDYSSTRPLSDAERQRLEQLGYGELQIDTGGG